MIIETSFEQCTREWDAARIGSPGASSFDKIVTSTGKPSAQRKKYMYQLAGEIMTETKTETYQNGHMQRGIELEPDARELFEFIQEKPVQQCAMIYPDDKKRYHISPDGIIPADKV